MDESRKKITMAQFKDIINMYSPCMDDFLYVYNVSEDHYFISPSSLDRFMIPANRFHHVMQNLKSAASIYDTHQTQLLKIWYHQKNHSRTREYTAETGS